MSRTQVTLHGAFINISNTTSIDKTTINVAAKAKADSLFPIAVEPTLLNWNHYTRHDFVRMINDLLRVYNNHI